MLIVNEKQIKELKPYLKDIERLIEEDDLQNLLEKIYDIIINNILGNNDEPDEEGIILQRIYDEIYRQN